LRERLPSGVGCPEYAIPGKSRCEQHQREAMVKRDLSPGTTPAWRKARNLALERTGYRCERCGRTDAQSRAEGGGGLHVHHIDGRGVRAQEHDQALLEVRCPPCHRLTLRRKTRPTVEEWKEGIVDRATARRASSG
jgi:DNA-directed RNA polymerase subunit RPC12/RpoP